MNQESLTLSFPLVTRDGGLRHGGLVVLIVLGCLLGACQHPAPRPVTASTMRVFEPSLATFGDHAILGWHGGETEGNAIYLQRLDEHLNTWSRPILITDPTAEAFEPDLQPFAGDLLVAWYAKEGEPAVRSALMSLVDWSGHVKWRRTLSKHAARNPVVRVADGVIWTAWLEDGESESAEVFTQKFTADGAPVEEPRRAGPASHDTWNLNAAVDPQGTFYVIYDATVGSGAKEIHLISADAHGVRHTLLSGDDGVASVYPDIATSAERVAVSWVNVRQGSDQLMLFVGGLDALSGTLDALARPVTSLAGHASGAYLAWNGARLGLAWNHDAGNASRVLVQRFDSSGRALSKSPVALRRDQAMGHAGVPAISAWHGGFAIAWNEYEQAPGVNRRILHSAALLQAVD